MTSAHPDHGLVCWVDIGARDQARAAAFYGTLFGWTYTTPNTDHYQVAHLQGFAVSGLGPAEGTGLPYWTVILGVTDIEATFTAFINAGATAVEEPSPVHSLGRSAIVTDPWGSPVSLWQSGSRGGMQRRGEPGTLATVELFSAHPNEAAAFYTEAMDWQFSGHHLTNHGVPVALLSDTPPSSGSSSHNPSWLVHFATENLDATTDLAIELGAERVCVNSYADIVLRDPEGALFGLTATT